MKNLQITLFVLFASLLIIACNDEEEKIGGMGELNWSYDFEMIENHIKVPFEGGTYELKCTNSNTIIIGAISEKCGQQFTYYTVNDGIDGMSDKFNLKTNWSICHAKGNELTITILPNDKTSQREVKVDIGGNIYANSSFTFEQEVKK